MNNKIYFAHPVNIYGEPVEGDFIKLIADSLAGGNLARVENPNQPCHQEGYDKYATRLKESGTDHRGMNYFYDEVLPTCSGCVGVPFLDGRLGLGVAGEMKWFVQHGKSVWIASPYTGPTAEDLFGVVGYPLADYFLIRLMDSIETRHLLSGDPKLVVPHEETRLRTWKIYNIERRPYEEAHLVQMPIPEGFYPKG